MNEANSTMKPPISLSLSATLFLLLTLYPAKSTAWLPWSNKNITSINGTNLFEQTNGKIRGVNLASLFVLEPWMAPSEWSSMGCADTKSEFDCVLHLGQDKADASFRQHWDTWITRDDFRNITALGLNTVRVPVGYWLYEELVDRESEYFPRGGWEFFERVCRWAAEEGVYVIVDLHGAPGAQVAMNPDTGQVCFLLAVLHEGCDMLADEYGLYSTHQAPASTTPTSTTVQKPSWHGSQPKSTVTATSAR